jgi:hypothetical protein
MPARDPQETNDHFLLCTAPSRLLWRTKFLSSLDRELRRLQTDALLIKFLKQIFANVFARIPIVPPPQFLDVAQSQASIGWLPLFRGFWSQSWLDTHQTLVTLRPGRTPKEQAKRLKHQDQWLASVVSFILRQTHQLWLLRNNERHGVTPAEKESRLRITIERELEALYASRPDCQPQHRTLFMADIATHRQKPLMEIRNWLSMYSTIIKISCQRHLDDQVLGSAVT